MLGQPARARGVGAHDHVVGIDAVGARAAARAPRGAGRSPPTSRAPRPASRRSRSARRRCSRPMRRRCSITSGTPPARNTCTVGWLRGPLGSASTSRGVARLMRVQSSTRRARAAPPRARSPGCAAAGSSSRRTPRAPASRSRAPPASGSPTAAMLRRRQPHQRAAPSAAPCPARPARPTAPARCAAATCPNASATTCDVAAVPRNWQPPPGVPHARQPIVGRVVERDQAVREARADRLHLAGVLGADRPAASRRRAR